MCLFVRAFIIAEIGSNWEGSVNKAQKIIKECKNAGADAVKFQMWRASDLYSKKHPNWKVIKKSELTFEKARKIKQFSDKIGIEFFCSAFYPEAVEFLNSLYVKRFKVASRTCLLKDPYSLQVINKEASLKKPIIISTGMGGHIKKIKKIFSKNKTTFCYCISEYPTPLKKINWRKAVKYDCFSDHTLGIIVPIMFTMLKKQKGAKQIFIEKHVKSKNSKGPDSSTSINTTHLKELVTHVRMIEKMKF